MALTPRYDSADPFFNADAARAAFELVMKMDDDEARAFTTMVTVDTLWDTIEKNQRTLQRHLNDVIKRRTEVAVEVLSKYEGTEELVEEISKAGHNPYYYGYQYNEADFNRDRRTGQFRKKVNYTATKPLNARTAESYGIPTKDTHPHLKGLSDHQLAEYQQGYMQISNFLEPFLNDGMAADNHFVYLIDRFNKDGQRTGQYTVKRDDTEIPEINPRLERIEGVTARPSGLTAGGAAFGLVSSLSGNDQTAWRAADKMTRFEDPDKGFGAFGDSWLDAGDDSASSNARLYSRVKSGSDFLGHMSYGNPKLQVAAKFGSLVGQHGPQAEKVIGPRARLTMYRYRGTEKTPDSELTTEYDKAMRSPTNVDGSESGTTALRTAIAFMAKKIPNKQLYDLNLKSGHTPPSEGVIIDKNGQIVTQAVGYGDDHYLPFNLRNLGKLNGGEYVRTRSVGGPTSEDIYTGLVSGAKRLTVVSRSGTFIVDFDDTFRGTRRYNDKAGRMIDRYEKLLDAVKSEQVIRQPLEPSVKQNIRDEVMRTMSWASGKEQKAAIKRKEDEYKIAPRITSEDERQIEAQVRHAAGDDERLGNQIRAQLRNQILESKAYNYKLNGDGYYAALQALQEQFPFYILPPRYSPRRDVGTYESEGDQGYVKPRHNRPQGALEGYYDATIAGVPKSAAAEKTGKFTADTADYQNWKLNPQNPNHRGGPSADPGAAPGTPGTPGTPGASPEARAGGSESPQVSALAGAIAHRKKQEQFIDTAVTLRNQVKANGVGKGANNEYIGLFGLPDDEFKEAILSRRGEFEQAIEPFRQQFLNNPQFAETRKALVAYDAAKGMAGGKPFDRNLHLDTVPQNPFDFTKLGPEYSPTGDVGRKRQTILELGQKYDFIEPSLDKQLDDKDFKATLKNLIDMRKVAQDIQGTGADADAVAAARSNGLLDNFSDKQISAMVHEPSRIDDAIEATNQAWALNAAAIEAQGTQIDRMLDVPSNVGDHPKARESEPDTTVITAPPRTIQEKRAESVKFLKAIDQLAKEAQGLEESGRKKDHKRAAEIDDLISDLRASNKQPFSVLAQETWNRYLKHVNGN